MQLLENSVSISGLKADDFDAIFVPGGHGIAGCLCATSHIVVFLGSGNSL